MPEQPGRESTRRVSGLVVLTAALLVAPPASAYCRSTTKTPSAEPCPAERCVTEGAPFFWPVDETSYVLHESGFPRLDERELRAVLERAFGHWQAAPCPDGLPLGLKIVQDPGTSSLRAGPREDEPNDNVVAHLTGEEWEAASFDRYAFAFTFMWFDADSGQVRGSDMLFNGGRGELGVCPDTGCVDGMVDLENVATHEAGHFLGLAHSDRRDTTMWCGAKADEVTKRALSSDDRAGVCAIYAKSEVARRRSEAGRSEGCTALAARGHARPVAPPAVALLLALSWLLGRRRRGRRRRRRQ